MDIFENKIELKFFMLYLIFMLCGQREEVSTSQNHSRCWRLCVLCVDTLDELDVEECRCDVDAI